MHCASEWKQVRDLVSNAYWLETTNDKSVMKNGIEKRLYNGEFEIFYTKSETAQNFVINTINGKIPAVALRKTYSISIQFTIGKDTGL